MLTETPPFREKGYCHVLADSCWEMFLKAVEEPLGTDKKVKESRWEMPKGYWPVSGKFFIGIGKPLINAQISATSQ